MKEPQNGNSIEGRNDSKSRETVNNSEEHGNRRSPGMSGRAWTPEEMEKAEPYPLPELPDDVQEEEDQDDESTRSQ